MKAALLAKHKVNYLFLHFAKQIGKIVSSDTKITQFIEKCVLIHSLREQEFGLGTLDDELIILLIILLY